MGTNQGSISPQDYPAWTGYLVHVFLMPYVFADGLISVALFEVLDFLRQNRSYINISPY